MPGLYLAVIVVSLVGVGLLARRFLPGVVGTRLALPVVAVLVVFLAFDWVGADRGWFASNPDWVVAIVPPGIPPEEPLLLAFLALFSVVLLEGFARVTGERGRGGAPGRGGARGRSDERGGLDG